MNLGNILRYNHFHANSFSLSSRVEYTHTHSHTHPDTYTHIYTQIETYTPQEHKVFQSHGCVDR
jgi:hypothetical protein